MWFIQLRFSFQSFNLITFETDTWETMKKLERQIKQFCNGGNDYISNKSVSTMWHKEPRNQYLWTHHLTTFLQHTQGCQQPQKRCNFGSCCFSGICSDHVFYHSMEHEHTTFLGKSSTLFPVHKRNAISFSICLIESLSCIENWHHHYPQNTLQIVELLHGTHKSYELIM